MEEKLKYIITRYDNYINFSNVKGSFIVTLNTFIVGAVLVNRTFISEKINLDYHPFFEILLLTLCFAALVILFFTIRALFPYTLSGNSSKDEYHSHIYFGSVSKFENAKEYISSLSKLDDNKFAEDLATQAFVLAKGVTRKYKMLDISMHIIYLELVIFLAIFILILV
ncbi:Pycsar system effector family protein [Flavobacterium pallidum]|uniref:Pycsar effector protein domain-containing protein n=1 Tax=Flavobacterium pallidum TaxID=2172098 RepID=A0A2S1SIB0_9FLAO|nr:Pycsar system effector family protein [Flavobacterium pallidum]AWI26125.1 hypothetical protein HYN49_09570 [Flavobacterium pallidum]